jgi:Fur family peroxide stress response transcriptional regulator
MSLSTVYNTLEALQKKSYLRELTIDPDRKRYDPTISNHHHLICLPCRKIVDVHKEYEIPIPDEQRGAFEITGNHIAFYGMCPSCTKKKEM